MNIPSSVATWTAVGRFLAVDFDGYDGDTIPDGKPVPGLTVTLQADIGGVASEDGFYFLNPLTLHTNQAGLLVNPVAPDEPITVVASQPLGERVRWLVTVTAPGFDTIRAEIEPAAGEVFDLSQVVHYPPMDRAAQDAWDATLAEVRDSMDEIREKHGETLTARDEAVQASADATAIAVGDVIDDSGPRVDRVFSSGHAVGVFAPVSHSHGPEDLPPIPDVVDASTSVKGVARFATPAQTVDGVSGSLAVTPAGVRSALDAAMVSVAESVVGDSPTLWSAPSQTVLVTPTHDGSGEATHPSVLYFEDGWNGYKYWMGMTPYPDMAEAHEDPNILVSNNGTTWTVPAGLTNPLDNQAGSPSPHNSDTNLVMRGNTMHLIWRMVDRPNGNTNRMFWRTSTDGVTWTAKQEIFTGGILAPSLVWTGSRWEMFGVENWTMVRWHTTVTNPSTSTVWTRTVINIPRPPEVDRWWHFEVKRHPSGKYVATMMGYDARGAARGGDLYMATSDDGLAFTTATRPLLPAPPAGESRYAGSIVPVGDSMELFFGRIVWTSDTSAWRIVRAPMIRAGNAGAVAERAATAVPDTFWHLAAQHAEIDTSKLSCWLEGDKARMQGRITRAGSTVLNTTNIIAGLVPIATLRPVYEERYPCMYGGEIGQVRIHQDGRVMLMSHLGGSSSASIAANIDWWVDIAWRV